MVRIFTSAFVLFCTFGYFSNLNSQITLQTDSTFVYREDGSKKWYYIQKDVFCFLNSNQSQYSGSVASCVDMMGYWDQQPAAFNEICFNPNSAMGARENQIDQVKYSADYEISSYALANEPNQDHSEEEYYRTDDKLLITFHDPLLDITTIQGFMNQYNLELYHEPFNGLPTNVSWTYIFKIIPIKGEEITSIKLAQEIFENEPNLVKISEPNMYGTTPLGCTPTSEMLLQVGSPLNTQGTWHISNAGGAIWDSGVGIYNGTNDADADVCECWGEGYTGNGIKIGVVDFGEIEFSHDDFSGTNIPGAYDAASNVLYTTDYFYGTPSPHAMNVLGIIGATPNNSSLGQRYAVGAAYGAELRPYTCSPIGTVTNSVLNGQIAVAIQRAVLDKIDVLNMSFQTGGSTASITLQIDNAVNTGRFDSQAPNNAWGMVLVAAVGNNDSQVSIYPANLPNVIGVGYSNPEDYRCSSNAPGANGGWSITSGDGSNYGPPFYNYDVLAPGELMMTTGSNFSGIPYSIVSGSSYASPLVASIAGLLLEKNPDQSWDQIRDNLRAGADKVHPTTYDYNQYTANPGYNDEMFYGRVSCINSLNNTPLGIVEQGEEVKLTVIRESLNKYTIYVPETSKGDSYQIYDMSGRMINLGYIGSNSNQIDVDLSLFSGGVYILRVLDKQKPVGAVKLIK